MQGALRFASLQTQVNFERMSAVAMTSARLITPPVPGLGIGAVLPALFTGTAGLISRGCTTCTRFGAAGLLGAGGFAGFGFAGLGFPGFGFAGLSGTGGFGGATTGICDGVVGGSPALW